MRKPIITGIAVVVILALIIAVQIMRRPQSEPTAPPLNNPLADLNEEQHKALLEELKDPKAAVSEAEEVKRLEGLKDEGNPKNPLQDLSREEQLKLLESLKSK